MSLLMTVLSKVNTKHKYYYQVQHQMFVTGKTWTDFVVKGSLDNSLYIERVEFNSVFWAEVLPKLKSFFNKYMHYWEQPCEKYVKSM